MKNNYNELTFITADKYFVVTKAISLFLKEIYHDVTVYQIHHISDITRILEKRIVNLIILGISFPGENGLDIIPQLKRIQSDLKVLVFYCEEDKIDSEFTVNAGVEFLNKSSSESDIKQKILQMMR